jgi:hypothetical protein
MTTFGGPQLRSKPVLFDILDMLEVWFGQGVDDLERGDWVKSKRAARKAELGTERCCTLSL